MKAGFNRNIVECKGGIQNAVARFHGVLIETLWNVKVPDAGQIIDMMKVLIETLWNVKWSTVEISDIFVIVLIETLWNVKSEIANR